MHVAIIGNSAAGVSALETFRRRDRTSTVTVVSAEGGGPYSRVLLPYCPRGRVSHKGLFIRPRGYYERFDARTVFGEVRAFLEERTVLGIGSASLWLARQDGGHYEARRGLTCAS